MRSLVAGPSTVQAGALGPAQPAVPPKLCSHSDGLGGKKLPPLRGPVVHPPSSHITADQRMNASSKQPARCSCAVGCSNTMKRKAEEGTRGTRHTQYIAIQQNKNARTQTA